MKEMTKEELQRVGVHKYAIFREAQAFLTCAGIAESLLTGVGPPSPRGLERITDERRASIRAKLHLPAEFTIAGRPQRNALLHIEERLVSWSKSGGLRGDFFTSPTVIPDVPAAVMILRAFGEQGLEFSIIGEKCKLSDVETSLRQLGRAAEIAVTRIIEEWNAKAMAGQGS